jgi:hypothetical protein
MCRRRLVLSSAAHDQDAYPAQSDQSTKDYRGRPAHDTPSQRVVIDLQSRVTDGIDPAWKSGPTVE